MGVCRNIEGNLTSDVFERRTSTGSMLFALLSRDFEHIREKTHSNTTNLVLSRHIARKKVHFRLTCVAQKRRCLNCLKTVTVGKHLPAPFITPPLPTLSSLHREIGSLSNNDGNDYEKVTSKVNSRGLKFCRAYNTSFNSSTPFYFSSSFFKKKKTFQINQTETF